MNYLCGCLRAAKCCELRRTPFPRTRVNRLSHEVAALYRGSVDIGEPDDFRELSDLLFGAKDRYRSARATISHTVDGTVA